MNKFDFLKEVSALETYSRRALIEMAINTVKLHNLIRFDGVNIEEYSKSIMNKVHDFNELFFIGCSDKYIKTIVHRIGNNDLFKQYINAIKCFKQIIDNKTTSSIADIEKSLDNNIKNNDNDNDVYAYTKYNRMIDNRINNSHNDEIDSTTLFIIM